MPDAVSSCTPEVCDAEVCDAEDLGLWLKAPDRLMTKQCPRRAASGRHPVLENDHRTSIVLLLRRVAVLAVATIWYWHNDRKTQENHYARNRDGSKLPKATEFS